MDTGLNDAVKEVKDPERRINLWVALIVVSVLWGVVVLLVRTWGEDLLEENQALKTERAGRELYYQHKIDSANAIFNAFVVKRLEQKENENIEANKAKTDSVNTELIKIQNALKSK